MKTLEAHRKCLQGDQKQLKRNLRMEMGYPKGFEGREVITEGRGVRKGKLRL